MTALNKQALREAAQEEIMLRSVSDTSDAWQDEASPEAVLALLDELEAKGQRFAELELRLSQQQSIAANNLDMFRRADARVAELEAREVKLPTVEGIHPLGPHSAKLFCYFKRSVINECADAIRAAGIGVKGE
ncbi:TPA: hypothetical protein R8H18_000874 [Citrobacter freundii]|uniref:hypothetical protein n=1 Tax=Citrobacter freundii TaxID=546 RepID=UPI00292C58B6|nr:hypothetical protein [Citrobacter freundii]MDV0835060.1 hypothetical protein [Citrobacter freundii]MDV0870906.1 hypothetical protein [Citrobacter freundii]MDV0905236.1 hypothetical protein [Citrobacter freundii]MDV1669963.1 hypothetical protein [Citrobacter freundii]MDV1708184.1 hypothetical protein [Citrobacter freundii]